MDLATFCLVIYISLIAIPQQFYLCSIQILAIVILEIIKKKNFVAIPTYAAPCIRYEITTQSIHYEILLSEKYFGPLLGLKFSPDTAKNIIFS